MNRREFDVWMKQVDKGIQQSDQKQRKLQSRSKTTKSISKRTNNQISVNSYAEDILKSKSRRSSTVRQKHKGKNQKQLIEIQKETDMSRVRECVKEITETQSEVSKNHLTVKLSNVDPLFRKLQYSLIETIVFLSKINLYRADASINAGCSQKIAFVLFGKVLMSNQDYETTVQRGNTFGQHILFNKHIEVSLKALQETAIMWFPIRHYQMIRQQSIKSGLKQEFYQLQSLIRLSFIQKKIK